MTDEAPVVDNPYIGRIVTAASPFIASLATVIANWTQDVIGADLDETQLTIFLTGVFVSVIGVVITWLVNRGAYERIVETGQTIHEAGKKYAPPAEVESKDKPVEVEGYQKPAESPK